MASHDKASSNRGPYNRFVSLKSMRNLRSWFKDATSADIQDVIGQLEKLKLDKMREEDELYGRPVHIANSLSSNTSSCSMSLDARVSPQMIVDGLIDRLSCRSRRYRSIKVKYRYYDLDGNLCEWSGQGRVPVKLRELMEKTGKTREDFLVKDGEALPNLEQSPSELRISMGIDNAFRNTQQRRIQEAIATLYPEEGLDDDMDLPEGSNLDDENYKPPVFKPKLLDEHALTFGNKDSQDPPAEFTPEDLIEGERHIVDDGSLEENDSMSNHVESKIEPQANFVNKLRSGTKLDHK